MTPVRLLPWSESLECILVLSGVFGEALRPRVVADYSATPQFGYLHCPETEAATP